MSYSCEAGKVSVSVHFYAPQIGTMYLAYVALWPQLLSELKLVLFCIPCCPWQNVHSMNNWETVSFCFPSHYQALMVWIFLIRPLPEQTHKRKGLEVSTLTLFLRSEDGHLINGHILHKGSTSCGCC